MMPPVADSNTTPDVGSRSCRRGRIAAAALIIAFTVTAVAGAQPRGPDESEREREVIEALRREDPAEADRYVGLSSARAQAIAELRRAEAQYNAAGAELRPAFTASLRQAQRKYAETSLALLDFFDTRERRALVRYREEIERIQKLLDDRQRTRADLEKLLGK